MRQINDRRTPPLGSIVRAARSRLRHTQSPQMSNLVVLHGITMVHLTRKLRPAANHSVDLPSIHKSPHMFHAHPALTSAA
jgi:hypothetical protein